MEVQAFKRGVPDSSDSLLILCLPRSEGESNVNMKDACLVLTTFLEHTLGISNGYS